MGRPVLCWGSHSNSSRCRRQSRKCVSVCACVCVCLRERSRLGLRWESMQALREERIVWGFYDGAPVERRQGCSCVCVCVCVCACEHEYMCACVRNGGSPVSCLQPRVHSQQSLCGEYDGKVHAYSLHARSAETLGKENSVMFCLDLYMLTCLCV